LSLNEIMRNMPTSDGSNVLSKSEESLVLIFFLRQFGCIFCKEALMDMAHYLPKMKEQGILPIYVHMADEQTAIASFAEYKISNPIHVPDPQCKYYQAFGLIKGRFNQLLGLRTMVRGFEATKTKGLLPGLSQFPGFSSMGDGFQMPGIFLVKNGEIIESFIHSFAGERPDYDRLLACCTQEKNKVE
jgi:hypothetical protein